VLIRGETSRTNVVVLLVIVATIAGIGSTRHLFADEAKTDFDVRYPDARTDDREPHWPESVRKISQDGLEFVGVGDDGRLYWDGQEVVTSTRIELVSWEWWFAAIGAGSALVIAIIEILRFFAVQPPTHRRRSLD